MSMISDPKISISHLPDNWKWFLMDYYLKIFLLTLKLLNWMINVIFLLNNLRNWLRDRPDLQLMLKKPMFMLLEWLFYNVLLWILLLIVMIGMSMLLIKPLLIRDLNRLDRDFLNLWSIWLENSCLILIPKLDLKLNYFLESWNLTKTKFWIYNILNYLLKLLVNNWD